MLDAFRPRDRVAIVVSDSFRQTGVCDYLAILLDGLNERGIRDSDVIVLFSTGTHRGPTPEEQRTILGETAYARLNNGLLNHDAHDSGAMRYLGDTSRGTPVSVNRMLMECERVIVTGAVVLHYFGGYGGGRKSLVPGLASVGTIAANHAMNLHPDHDELDPAVRIGQSDGNPVAEDMLEAARMIRIDGIVNTVLNRDGGIAGLFAGELDAAHRAACNSARECYAIPIESRADLVIAASAHTRNFVQTHKALYNAYQAMAPGGRIVLAAPCPEGLGGKQFTQWLELGDRASIITALRRQSEINGQTALSTREKAPSVLLVTHLNDADVNLLGARKSDNLQEAVETALAELCAAGRATPRIALMPNAAYSVPFPPV